MTRPRIRTIKPEASQDESIGRLSRDARLLFFTGLVTLADDEGRLRAMPSTIIGHTFPYDDDVQPSRLRRWLDEIEREGLILRYASNGVEYLAIRHFKRHQRINRPSASVLPPPPDHNVVTENSWNGHGESDEKSLNDHVPVIDDSSPHAQARVPIPSLKENNSNAPSRASRVTYKRKVVPEARVTLATVVLSHFNAQACTDYGPWTGTGVPSDSLTRIIGALTAWPEKLTGSYCRELIEHTLRSPWWDGAPTVGVVFGPGAIEGNMARLDAKRAGGNGSRSRRTDVRAELEQARGSR